MSTIIGKPTIVEA